MCTDSSGPQTGGHCQRIQGDVFAPKVALEREEHFFTMMGSPLI